MLELVRPALQYKTSYLEALAEFQRERRYTFYNLSELRGNFAAHVESERAWIHPENIVIFRVPETIYWLVREREFLGRLELRHQLYNPVDDVAGHIGYSIRPSERGRGFGTLILALGLEEASAYGMRRVLLTCDPDNIASRRVIERNGGRLERRIERVIDGVAYNKLRYWIELKAPRPAAAAQRDERPPL